MHLSEGAAGRYRIWGREYRHQLRWESRTGGQSWDPAKVAKLAPLDERLAGEAAPSVSQIGWRGWWRSILPSC